MTHKTEIPDHGLGNLLELDGEIVSFENGMWAKFEARRIPPDAMRPHGIRYSLTLHDPDGNRVFGIDNAHLVRSTGGPAGKRHRSADRLHRGGTVQPYRFRDAEKLLLDFWAEVEKQIGG